MVCGIYNHRDSCMENFWDLMLLRNEQFGKQNLTSALVGAWYVITRWEISIFNPEFERHSIFDIQFASLSIFDPAHTNSFNLRDYEGFLLFLISSCFFTLFRTLEMTILPSAHIRWPRRSLSPRFPRFALFSHNIFLAGLVSVVVGHMAGAWCNFFFG